MKLPTLFRGVWWNDGWEFDAPCVITFPFKRYGYWGNSSVFDQMVQGVCSDLAMGLDVRRGWSESDLHEFRWRGWSTRFERRKNAWHIAIKVAWFTKAGARDYRFVTRREQWGAPV